MGCKSSTATGWGQRVARGASDLVAAIRMVVGNLPQSVLFWTRNGQHSGADQGWLPANQVEAGMAKRTTRITVETRRTLIIQRANPVRAWCSHCAAEVDTVVLDAAGVLAQVDDSTIQQWLGAEELHAVQMKDGMARICLDSLLRSASRALPQTIVPKL